MLINKCVHVQSLFDIDQVSDKLDFYNDRIASRDLGRSDAHKQQEQINHRSIGTKYIIYYIDTILAFYLQSTSKWFSINIYL